MNNYGTAMTAGYANPQIASSKRNIARLEKQLMKKRTLKQKLRSWLLDEETSPPPNDDICIDENGFNLSRERSIKFEIHNANGGRIVQTRRYDAQKDRHFENLYVITSDQDFGRELDKIITMEALR